MMQGKKPAVITGIPEFASPIPVTRPALDVEEGMFAAFRKALESGYITNADQVRDFEREAAEFLSVENVIAVNSCTAGLMLVLRCLSATGEAILPSFTFMASGHAAIWSGLVPVLADCDDLTYTLDPASVDTVSGESSAVVIATHIFGVPCAADALQAVAARRGLDVVYDAAHGFGSVYADGRPVGCRGIAEVFSLSPTKNLTAGEGGLIATNDGELAKQLRIARNYGNPGDYDSLFAGLNGRLGELNAALGRVNLARLPERLDRRRRLAAQYRNRLAGVPGIGFQHVEPEALTGYKDFVIRVNAEEFGVSRNVLAEALAADNISTRKYFDPPLHRQRSFATAVTDRDSLDVTDRLSRELLTLPLFDRLEEKTVDRVCETIVRVHRNSEEVSAALTADG
ncbi:DegT/DnrJ/EryC1/StrS family aminotransferase [Streptosporangium sp. NPDC000396]|uniref:DegT/DnrJ/EryC1/StrS family aminotransferase n=1 Tax=Streptosporangium sp. NPDC000396 TaxID=3366185 RepID=UPI00368A9947